MSLRCKPSHKRSVSLVLEYAIPTNMEDRTDSIFFRILRAFRSKFGIKRRVIESGDQGGDVLVRWDIENQHHLSTSKLDRDQYELPTPRIHQSTHAVRLVENGEQNLLRDSHSRLHILQAEQPSPPSYPLL